MAQCSAVAPSFCGALTSAFLSMRARTAALSPRMAASATSDLPARTTAGAANIPITRAASPACSVFRFTFFVSCLSLLDRSQLAFAVADGVLRDSELVENRQQQVAGRHGFGRVGDVAVALHLAVEGADEHVRDVVVDVLVRVAHVAAVEDERVIEQRPVAVLRGR